MNIVCIRHLHFVCFVKDYKKWAATTGGGGGGGGACGWWSEQVGLMNRVDGSLHFYQPKLQFLLVYYCSDR